MRNFELYNKVSFEDKLRINNFGFYFYWERLEYTVIKNGIFVIIPEDFVIIDGHQKAFDKMIELYDEKVSERKLKGLNVNGTYFDEILRNES